MSQPYPSGGCFPPAHGPHKYSTREVRLSHVSFRNSATATNSQIPTQSDHRPSTVLGATDTPPTPSSFREIANQQSQTNKPMTSARGRLAAARASNYFALSSQEMSAGFPSRMHKNNNDIAAQRDKKYSNMAARMSARLEQSVPERLQVEDQLHQLQQNFMNSLSCHRIRQADQQLQEIVQLLEQVRWETANGENRGTLRSTWTKEPNQAAHHAKTVGDTVSCRGPGGLSGLTIGASSRHEISSNSLGSSLDGRAFEEQENDGIFDQTRHQILANIIKTAISYLEKWPITECVDREVALAYVLFSSGDDDPSATGHLLDSLGISAETAEKALHFQLKNSSGLARVCIEYIKLCRYQLDLYEYFQSKGIGQLSHLFISSFAEFLENEGDPFLDGPRAMNHGCICDYRYAESLYSKGGEMQAEFKTTLEQLAADLRAQEANQPIVEAIERFIDAFQSSHVDPLGRSFGGFKTRIRGLAGTDVGNAQNGIKANAFRKRSREEAKKIIERNRRLYGGDRVKRACTGHSLIVGGHDNQPGAYQIYVDDEFLYENIEEGKHFVETFYDGLDDIDQYDDGQDGDNFLIKRIRQKNEALICDRQKLFKSFLEQQTWLIVNPNHTRPLALDIVKYPASDRKSHALQADGFGSKTSKQSKSSRATASTGSKMSKYDLHFGLAPQQPDVVDLEEALREAEANDGNLAELAHSGLDGPGTYPRPRRSYQDVSFPYNTGASTKKRTQLFNASLSKIEEESERFASSQNYRDTQNNLSFFSQSHQLKSLLDKSVNQSILSKEARGNDNLFKGLNQSVVSEKENHKNVQNRSMVFNSYAHNKDTFENTRFSNFYPQKQTNMTAVYPSKHSVKFANLIEPVNKGQTISSFQDLINEQQQNTSRRSYNFSYAGLKSSHKQANYNNMSMFSSNQQKERKSVPSFSNLSKQSFSSLLNSNN